MSWNKSNSRNLQSPLSTKAIRASRWLYYIIAGCLVFVIGAAVYFCLPSKTQNVIDPDRKAVAEKPKVLEKLPAKVVEEKKEQKPQKELNFWEVDAAHTNGFTEMQMRKWRKEHRPPPGYTNDAAVVRSRAKYAIFSHESENKIAALLTLEPGQTMIGSFDLRGVQADFLKSCEVPIVVTKEDSPETAALKNLMNEVKIELKERIADGEKLEDILSETQKEYQRLARCRMEMQQAINELKEEGISSEQELDDILSAANKILEEKGIAPIELGPIARHMFLRHIKKGD